MSANTHNRTKKAFSLLQIVFSFAVIAIMIAMSIAGIFVLQKSSREKNRELLGAELSQDINDYRRTNLRYPTKSQVEFRTLDVRINNVVVANLKGSLVPARTTSSSGTRYFYNSTSGGFTLCILMESNEIQSFGTESCPPIATWTN